MGFWIFMLLVDLLLPLTMIVLGKLFMKRPPKNINAVFGYRTAMSMKNGETWEFAHGYCGKLWFIFGLILLPISIVSMVSVFTGKVGMIGTVGGIVCAVQLIPMVASVFLTEAALKKNFDKNGVRL